MIGIFSIECLFNRCITHTYEYNTTTNTTDNNTTNTNNNNNNNNSTDNSIYIPFTNSELRLLWEQQNRRILKLIKKYNDSITTPDHILSMKEDILLIIDTISDSALDLTVEPMYDILNYLWERFEIIQINSLQKTSKEIYTSNLNILHKINNIEEYNKTVLYYGLQEKHNIQASSGIHTNNIINDDNSTASSFHNYLINNYTANNSPNNNTNYTNNNTNTNNNNTPVPPLYPTDPDPTTPTATSNNTTTPLKQGQDTYTTPAYTPQQQTPHTHTPQAQQQQTPQTQQQQQYPQTFSYSSAVPLIMKELHLIIIRCFIFAYKGIRNRFICVYIVLINST